MSETINALGEKLQPRKLYDQFVGTLQSYGGQSRVIEIVKENPIPVGLIAAGVAWLVVEGVREQQPASSEYEYDVERPSAGQSRISGIRQSISDKIGAGRQKVSDIAGSVKEKISGAASSAKESLSGAMGSAKEKASQWTGSVQEQASGLVERSGISQMQPRQRFWDAFHDHPLAVAAGFAAAGVIAGLVLPTSRRERELIGPTAGRMMDTARESGRQMLEQTTEKVGNVARAAADAATERMQGNEPLLEKVKNMAHDAAQTAREQMRKEGLMTEEGMDLSSQKSVGNAPGTIGETSTKPQDTLDYPTEGRGGSNVPESSAFADRPSDAMAGSAKSSPEQPRDQIGDFTTDRPEGRHEQKDKGKDKGKNKK